MKTQKSSQCPEIRADPKLRAGLIEQPSTANSAKWAINTANPIVKGFMVGRTLWASASLRWLKNDISDAELVQEVAANLATLVEAWRSRDSVLPKLPATEKA